MGSTFTAFFHPNTTHWCPFTSDDCSSNDFAPCEERAPTTFHIPTVGLAPVGPGLAQHHPPSLCPPLSVSSSYSFINLCLPAGTPPSSYKQVQLSSIFKKILKPEIPYTVHPFNFFFQVKLGLYKGRVCPRCFSYFSSPLNMPPPASSLPPCPLHIDTMCRAILDPNPVSVLN